MAELMEDVSYDARCSEVKVMVCSWRISMRAAALERHECDELEMKMIVLPAHSARPLSPAGLCERVAWSFAIDPYVERAEAPALIHLSASDGTAANCSRGAEGGSSLSLTLRADLSASDKPQG
jgi:hypothetical protein